MMTRSRLLAVATTAGGLALAAPAGYLATLSVAAARAGKPAEMLAPTLRLAVLVPAHDEQLLVGRCVDLLMKQDYPRELVRIIVIADNCGDATAAVAAEHGAEVLERIDREKRGKGHALNWAMAGLATSDPGIAAFVVVDADSVPEPGLLRALAAAAQNGAEVVQGDYEALVEGEDDRAHLRAAAFLLFHRVRFTGKARLGLPCSLVGNGMLFTREVIEQHPWDAFSEVEDLEYTIQLRNAGIGPVFAPSGRLVAPVASRGEAAEVQRSRWEGGRLSLARRYLPRLAASVVSGRRPDLWDTAADLAVPPLGLLAAGIVAGTAGTGILRLCGLVPTAALIPWLAASTALPVHVLVGLSAADAPPATTRALRSAPALVASEGLVRARVLTKRPSGEFVRTPRTVPSGSPDHPAPGQPG